MSDLHECCCGKYTDEFKIKVPIKDVVKDLSVGIKVTGLTKFKLRLKVAAFIIKIACKIGGLSCEVDKK